MMKNSSRHGFTLVELLIGIVMMVIVIGGIAFAVSSGFDLYTKADSNAVVISGVRFTADSLNRSIAPMLNSTNEIEILSEDSSTTASKTVSDDIHYIYLSTAGPTKGSVVHRHKLLNGNMVNDVLEGSENIDKIGFSIPVSSVDQTENYILKIGIRGVNSNDIKAKLDLKIERALYNNKPTKTSPSASIVAIDGINNYVGNTLKIKAGFYLEALDLYDGILNINKSTILKGKNIKAVYDLINQTGTSESMLDTSSIDWFITESILPDLPVMADNLNPQSADRTSGLWQLVSGDTNIKIKGNILYTTSADKFKVATREWDTNWKNVIRCRVTPEIKSQSGGPTLLGTPKWSDYVVVKLPDPPVIDTSNLLESIVDYLGSPSNPKDIFVTTEGRTSGTDNKTTAYTVDANGKIKMSIGKDADTTEGASLAVKLTYDEFDNDIIYNAYKNRKNPTAADLPPFMTVTNYSVVLDATLGDPTKVKAQNTNTLGHAVFLNTRTTTGTDFKDFGFAVQFSSSSSNKNNKQVVSASEFVNGVLNRSTYNFVDGISYQTTANLYDHYYDPPLTQNSKFTFGKWYDRYRIMYTVLEYYDSTDSDPKLKPRYIYRVRFLKKLGDFTPAQLTEIKKTDPWCIGRDFFASEPMWFGDFVGNTWVGNTSMNNLRVNVKNYNYPSSFYSQASRILTNLKVYYALKPNSSFSGGVYRSQLLNIVGGTSTTNGYRFIGLKGIVKDKADVITVHNISLVPGFTINEIRSIMPANGKLYSLDETLPAKDAQELATVRASLTSKPWYQSYNTIFGTTSDSLNQKVFANLKKSDGSGNNGSIYFQKPIHVGGVADLQHLEVNCTCPMEDELFKWLRGE